MKDTPEQWAARVRMFNNIQNDIDLGYTHPNPDFQAFREDWYAQTEKHLRATFPEIAP
jgi:hypothetical protein